MNSLKEASMTLHSAMHLLNVSLYGGLPPKGRIHVLRNQGVEVWVAPLTIAPNDSLGDLMISVPITLGSSGLEILVHKGRHSCYGTQLRILLNYKLYQLPGNFGLCAQGKAGTKGVTILAGVIGLDYQDEIRLLLHNVGARRNTCKT